MSSEALCARGTGPGMQRAGRLQCGPTIAAMQAHHQDHHESQRRDVGRPESSPPTFAGDRAVSAATASSSCVRRPGVTAGSACSTPASAAARASADGAASPCSPDTNALLSDTAPGW